MARTHSKVRGIVKVHPEKIARHIEAKKRPAKRHPAPGQAPIAPGFTADHALDLTFDGGRTIAGLSFVNVYLGPGWAATDMSNIDAALSGALSDPSLNHVIQQYFQTPITTAFLGSRQNAAAIPATYTRDSVSATLDQLAAAGQLAGLDLGSTVINLLLPPGTILDTTAAGGVGDADDKDSSLQGLGGYHGSHQAAGNAVIYFAVSVYSQVTAKGPNGIPIWTDPTESWKNVVATLYHELNEARTDPDVEGVNRGGNRSLLGWYSDKGGEIGDIPIQVAQDIHTVFAEVPLQSGQTAPIQLMWSNAAGGPGEPF
jgi:hypothetical protein